jgi:hypothetical protein
MWLFFTTSNDHRWPGLYYKHITIVNYDSRIYNDAPSCGITYDRHSDKTTLLENIYSTVVISDNRHYDCNIFIVRATGFCS